VTPGTPGFRFRDWMERGHPEFGWPTVKALDYHLTTLFPEVRLRGFFEIRSADATPIRLRAAQVVFWVGLLYDPQARRAALDFLEPDVTRLQELWVQAARDGLADSDVHERSLTIWRLALEGAGRLPAGYFRGRDLRCAQEFLTKYVEAGRSPGDELRERMQVDPRAALEWSIALD
jgi:glutamate--cysteine ligase